MLKKYVSIICLIIISMFLCACSKGDVVKADSKFKQIEKDEIVICSDDFDLYFPSEGGINERRLRFPIIAGEDVKEEDIKIEIQNTEFEYFVSKEDKDEIEYYTYLSYTDVDWEKYAQLYRNDMMEFKEYDNRYVKEFETLDKKTLPNYNYYMVSICFDYEYMGNDINEVKVLCKDNEYKIKGSIVFGKDAVPDTNSEVFEEYGLAYDELTFAPNSQNKYYIDSIELLPTNDIEILDVFTMEGNKLKVNNVTISVEGDKSIDRVLKEGASVKVPSGDRCRLNIELIDEGDKKFTYTSNPIILIKYKMDGKEYLSNVNINARTILDTAQLYAKYVDGLNVDMYYDTFYKVF